MHILGIITARGKSKGLKNKHSLILDRKPVIWHTIAHARASRLITRVVCSSDSLSLLKVAQQYGVEGIRRPEKYARDSSPIEEPLRHVVTHLKNKEGYMPDIVALLYGNVPYRHEGLIDGALSQLCAQRAPAIVSVSATERFHPERLVTCAGKDSFKLYTRTISSFRRQDLARVYFIDSGIIAFRAGLLFGPDPLIISHYFKGHRVRAYISEGIGAWDIDNLFDFEIAKLIMEKKNSRGIMQL